jgi:hypothetical protein
LSQKATRSVTAAWNIDDRSLCNLYTFDSRVYCSRGVSNVQVACRNFAAFLSITLRLFVPSQLFLYGCRNTSDS